MKIERAMILAAGLGTRLLPVTKEVPKPLVGVLNVPNIDYTLQMLKRAGVKEVILNLHHLKDKMKAYLGDGKKWGLKFYFSEEETLLGTGGGVKKAEAFFKGGPFILANCDFITDVDLVAVVEEHFKRKALASTVLLDDKKRAQFYGSVGVSTEGTLCSLKDFQSQTPKREGIFTGIHVLDASLLRYLKEEPCDIFDVLYTQALKETPQKIFGTFLKPSETWWDTGEPKHIWSASMELLKKQASKVLLGEGVQVEKGSLGENIVLGKGSIVGKGAKLSNFIGLENTVVPAGMTVDGQLWFRDKRLF